MINKTRVTLLTEGINNWKLRLILSALLCIMGLAAMISMILGLFVELSVYDKTLVSIAIFMVGIPAYLIISGLAHVDEETIARFLSENVKELNGNVDVLTKDDSELNEEQLQIKQNLVNFFSENPVYSLLPDKPVKQAYFLMLTSLLISFAIWYIG